MTLSWRHGGDYWEPEGGERRPWRDLAAGDLLALKRQVWRVHAVRPVPVADWEDCDRQAFESCARRGESSEEDWDGRPLYLTISPVKGGRRRDVRGRPYAAYYGAWVLHPHYPACADCGEPWPCPELDITSEVRRQSAEFERLAAILPGCCWDCGEPVTSRQKSVRFDGENLLLPGSPPPAFHLRRKAAGGLSCLSAAALYEEKWVPAVPGRRWRLSCPGNVVAHLDGRECSETADCPGTGVRHRGGFMSHRFAGTLDGQVVPVAGSGAEHCRRCLDAVDAGFYAREQAEYLARKNSAWKRQGRPAPAEH